MTAALQFMGLIATLQSPEFRFLEVQGGDNRPRVSIEPLHGDDAAKLFHISQKGGKVSRVADASGVIEALGDYFNQGYEQVVCRTESAQIIYTYTPKGVRIKSEPLPQGEQNPERLKIDVKYLLETPRTRKLLTELGILTSEGAVRREQYNKLIQIKNFVNVIFETLPELRKIRPLNVVDGACGKSYLSFVLYHFLREEWGLDARFMCLDTNKSLIDRCRQIQSSVEYEQMEFFDSAIRDFEIKGGVGILYSLHGCDTASDEAIAAGVRLQSKVIMVVPCCHFELRGQLRRHPLKALTKFGLIEERFAALLTDALRALALEAAGYDTSLFRFVTDDVSPKNTLMRAVHHTSPQPNTRSAQQYQELRDMFGVSPAIERLLPEVLNKR